MMFWVTVLNLHASNIKKQGNDERTKQIADVHHQHLVLWRRSECHQALPAVSCHVIPDDFDHEQRRLRQKESFKTLGISL